MKISCQSCAAKYTIADEKVVGKVIKIKCKKCSSTIVVNGNDPATIAQLGAPASDGAGFDDQAATQLVNQSHGAAGQEPANPDEWTVSITDDDQRTMTTAQILTEYAKGALTADTYLWKDGMGDWLPIHQVEELAPLLSAASPASGPGAHSGNGTHAYENAAPAMTAPGSSPMGSSPMGQQAYESTVPFVAGQHGPVPQPFPAAAPTAARRVGGRQSVDLFGAGRDDGRGGAAMGAAGMTQPMGSDKHIGERNETSVLFSLKDLAAAEAAATAKPATKSAYAAKNDRVDDFLSLGGIGTAAPMLAPPSLNAPYIEPPPPPPSVAPVSAYPTAAPMYMPAPPQKKSPVPFIVGGLGALALIGGIIFFVAGSGGDKKTNADDTKTTTEKTDAKTEKTSETATSADATKTAETASTTATESASAAPSDSAIASASTSASTSAKGAESSKISLVDPKKDPKKEDPKKEDPKKEDPKKEDPKKEDPVATGGGDAPFDRGAASAAMSGAASRASGCKKADGPTGSTKVQVTFQPSGKGTGASVGAPFAGTSVGSCIAGAFKGLSIPPFSGAPVPVSKTVSIK